MYKPLLEKINSLSMAFMYKTYEEMYSYRELVEKLKNISNDKVNFLLPDETDNKNGYLYVSEQKILDNAVCDTVRIKYIPQKSGDNITEIIQNYKNYFLQISSYFQKYSLYHRSPSDGFISLRINEGILITSTKTPKVNLDLSRISLIHSYCPKTNVLIYSGKYLPSSDSVEAITAYDSCIDIKSIIHTHASIRYTRNSIYLNKIKVHTKTYGTYELGLDISNNIKHYLDDFFIMKDHGEIFALRNEQNLDDIGLKFKNILIQN
jgi:hypothetical protein